VKTQNQFARFQFWRFLIDKFAQNRATIDLIALFCAEKIAVTSFHSLDPNAPLADVGFPGGQFDSGPPAHGVAASER
jgi:hypothetical protein